MVSLRLVLTGLFWCVACSGNDFTSGSSGQGGSAGASVGGGSGGVTTGGSGGATGGSAGIPPLGGAAGIPSTGGTAGAPGGGAGGGPATCQLDGSCPSGEYCHAPGCGQGTCVPKGTSEDGSLAPVCGCDGVTYWNASVAAMHGMSVKQDGACNLVGGTKCSGTSCPGSAHCDLTVINQTACGVGDLAALCWMLPTNCTGAEQPEKWGCIAGGCKSLCKLMLDGEEYYNAGACL